MIKLVRFAVLLVALESEMDKADVFYYILHPVIAN
jgi:hypothetical protein